MIINLRGTSGSGKSTIVKELMGHYQHRVPMFVAGRQRPISYMLVDPNYNGLYVIGHYETACGGCDTISSLDQVYHYVTQAAGSGCHVLYEGIMASGEYQRCVKLHEAFPGQVAVVVLDVPIDLCLAGVQERRLARGNDTPLKPERTIRRQREVESMARYLRDAGVAIHRADRVGAAALCKSLLGIG